MITIHDKLWYVCRAKDEERLAYMTYHKEDKAFEKRRDTGIAWSGGQPRKVWISGKYVMNPYIPADVGTTLENVPQSGHYIGDSVSRWSTSNKLFRVKDPRGFTVEVSTGNIATLLHLCTVTNGVVQEECVWGREGANHVLLPVNSEPYRESVTSNSTILKMKDIKAGDMIKCYGDTSTYRYLGKVKLGFDIEAFYDIRDLWNSPSRSESRGTMKIKDPKWQPVFLCDRGYPYNSLTKMSEVVSNEEVTSNDWDKYTKLGVVWSNYALPDRILKKARETVGDYRLDGTVISMEIKG